MKTIKKTALLSLFLFFFFLSTLTFIGLGASLASAETPKPTATTEPVSRAAETQPFFRGSEDDVPKVSLNFSELERQISENQRTNGFKKKGLTKKAKKGWSKKKRIQENENCPRHKKRNCRRSH